MDNQFKIFKMLLIALPLIILGACGDEGDGKASVTNTTNTGGSSSGGSGGSSGGGSGGENEEEEETIAVAAYASIQTLTSNGLAAFSNEIQIPEDSGANITVSWDEPTRTISGDCLDDAITGYKVNIGTESGIYTVIEDMNLADVSCADSSVADTNCGRNIRSCSYAVDLSEFGLVQ